MQYAADDCEITRQRTSNTNTTLGQLVGSTTPRRGLNATEYTSNPANQPTR